MAKILDRVESFLLWEEAPGKLLWELEDGRPSLGSIEDALREFVSAIGTVKLVHGDLRPWNVFFESKTKQFTVIDWGYSCFIGEQKSEDARLHISGRNPGVADAEVDGVDLGKTIASLRVPNRTEEIWKLPPNIFSWRPYPWTN